MATICDKTITEGRGKFCNPGVRKAWKQMMLMVTGAMITSASGAAIPVKRRNPQVVSVILSKNKKYPDPMIPVMNAWAAGGNGGNGMWRRPKAMPKPIPPNTK